MTDWKKKFIEETIAEFGGMPAPWVYWPNAHPYSIAWRMGGEAYMACIYGWIDEQNWTLIEKAEYFRKQNPPPAWLIWVSKILFESEDNGADAIDIFSDNEDELKKFGFLGVDQVWEDLEDPKWD